MSQYTIKRCAEDELASPKNTKHSRHYLDSDTTYCMVEEGYMPAFGSSEAEHVFRQKLEHLQVEMKCLEQARVQDREERTKIEEEVKWSHKLLDQLDAAALCNNSRIAHLEDEVQQLQSTMKDVKNEIEKLIGQGILDETAKQHFLQVMRDTLKILDNTNV
ncbi:hypothetical protein BDR07DRAFT_1495253 [Suillus spraguei]|nr:hypothetical protein BDR07DRAFT_1495253 [Suillus spraguei]